MARNEEKAQSMLNRYLQMKNDAAGINSSRSRPALASQENNLVMAEKWRMQVMREIGKKVMDIQNESLGEFRIRDLNDEINKLIREKRHWERRIVELGGTHYASGGGARVTNEQGVEVYGGGGYKYFGAARKLRGVRELLKPAKKEKVKRTRAELYRNVDADYYGYRDDEDGELEPLEQLAEERAIEEAREEWEKEGRSVESSAMEELNPTEFETHVPVPSKEEMEQRLLEEKKRQLMDRYVSTELMEKESALKKVLGAQ